MKPPTTVGEAVDRYGPCELIVEVFKLAEARGRIPVGFWDVDGLPEAWRVVVNGTKDTRDGVKPWEVLVEHGGLPVASFNSAGGVAIGDYEDRILKMLRQVREGASL